jgi:hypothetical protein
MEARTARQLLVLETLTRIGMNLAHRMVCRSPPAARPPRLETERDTPETRFPLNIMVARPW